jgi:hypothetical protein
MSASRSKERVSATFGAGVLGAEAVLAEMAPFVAGMAALARGQVPLIRVFIGNFAQNI